MRHPATRSLVSLVLLLAVYYAIPEGVFPSAVTAGFSLLALVGGGGLLAWQITSQVRRQFERGDDEAVQLQSVLLLAYLGVIVFALGYYFMARSVDGPVRRPAHQDRRPLLHGQHARHGRLRRHPPDGPGGQGDRHRPDRLQPGVPRIAGPPADRPAA